MFPGSTRVHPPGLDGSHDDRIWRYARQHRLAIVTQDSDFIDRVKVDGAPPKVIWLRIGNTSTQALHRTISRNAAAIQDFLDDPDLEWMTVS